MIKRTILCLLGLALLCLASASRAGTEAQPEAAALAIRSTYDPALAGKVGADEHGMRHYVMVVLKTGPNTVPKGPQRDEMFKGHFANIQRLAAEGKLAVAGPFDGVDGWRGMFIFAVEDIEEAKKLVATDPVVINGEMTPEFHKYYGTAALMLINDLHNKVTRQPF